MALDPDTYLSRTQEHRHEVPEPCAQPHQQPEGPQEPRPEAERAQWRHFSRAHCQDDSRGEGDPMALGLGGWVEAGLGAGQCWAGSSCCLALRAVGVTFGDSLI